MAERILVIGDTGCGKSTSLRTLDPTETFISQVASKALPFKGWRKDYSYWDTASNPKGNLIVRDTSEGVCNVMRYINKNMPEKKNLIIDDAQYIMSKEYMNRANESGYNKFAEFAQHMSDVLLLPDSLREDLRVIYLWHTDIVNDIVRMKTVGKMLDSAITPEGLFTYVFWAKKQVDSDGNINFVFVTRTEGNDVVKTPLGMFEEQYIPNDMQLVLDTIHKYNYGE